MRQSRSARKSFVWSPTKAHQAFRAAGMTPREVENAMFGRGLRVKVAHWFTGKGRCGPSTESFAELVRVLGMETQPFDQVVRKFFDWR